MTARARENFRFEGPDLKITSGAVIALAMTLNELCTNTTKFGALSVPAGRIEIAWSIDAKNERLHLTWSEKDGPAVHAADPAKFRHPADRNARQAVERQGRTGLCARTVSSTPSMCR